MRVCGVVPVSIVRRVPQSDEGACMAPYRWRSPHTLPGLVSWLGPLVSDYVCMCLHVRRRCIGQHKVQHLQTHMSRSLLSCRLWGQRERDPGHTVFTSAVGSLPRDADSKPCIHALRACVQKKTGAGLPAGAERGSGKPRPADTTSAVCWVRCLCPLSAVSAVSR